MLLAIDRSTRSHYHAQHARIAMRSVAGVTIAFLSMMLLVFGATIAPWFVLGLDAVLKPEAFDSTPAFNVYAVVVGFGGGVVAGWLCATIARARVAVISLATLSFVLGMTNAVGQARKPEPGRRGHEVAVAQAVALRKEPLWFTLSMPSVGVGGVFLGGRGRRARRVPTIARTA
jgi:hypothetical protein